MDLVARYYKLAEQLTPGHLRHCFYSTVVLLSRSIDVTPWYSSVEKGIHTLTPFLLQTNGVSTCYLKPPLSTCFPKVYEGLAYDSTKVSMKRNLVGGKRSLITTRYSNHKKLLSLPFQPLDMFQKSFRESHNLLIYLFKPIMHTIIRILNLFPTSNFRMNTFRSRKVSK